MAFDRLIENIVKMQNPTVAGLDPKLDYVPESIKTKCFESTARRLRVRLLHFLNSTRRLLTHFMILFLP